jgi:hypothetical protein
VTSRLVRFILFTGIVALVTAGRPARVFAQSSSSGLAAGSTSTAALVVLRLTNNTMLVGTIVSEEGDTIVFDAGTLGKMTLKKSDVVARMDPTVVAAALQAPGTPAPTSGGMSHFATENKATWSRTATVGGTYTTSPYILGGLDPAYPGLTGKALRLPGVVYQFQGSVAVVRTAPKGVASFDASETYSFADNAGVQADATAVAFVYQFRLKDSKKVYEIARYNYSRDAVRKIDFSNQMFFAVGVKLVDNKKVSFDVAPGFGAQIDKKGTPFDDRLLFGGGGMEQLTINVTPFAQIVQQALGYQAATERQYWGLQSYVGFKGMLTKVLGVQFGLVNTIDNSLGLRESTIPPNTLFPGQAAFGVRANERSQAMITAGIQIKF